MTAIKRCCALALAVLMILTALPVTAFAETAAHETNASLHETTLDGIANDITRQVLRSSQKDGERIQMENTAKLDDSDEVEIIVVVNDSVPTLIPGPRSTPCCARRRAPCPRSNAPLTPRWSPSGSTPPCSTASPPR